VNAVARRSDPPPEQRDAILAPLTSSPRARFLQCPVAAPACRHRRRHHLYRQRRSARRLRAQLREGLTKAAPPIAIGSRAAAAWPPASPGSAGSQPGDRVQVELRQSTKFMERFSATLLRDYLGLIRKAVAGPAQGCSAPT
jgi:hypothetical protein